MRKLLIIKISYEYLGGVDRQILRIAKEFTQKRFFEISLATNHINSHIAEEFKKLGLKVYQVNIGENYSILKGVKSINKLLKDNHFDFIQSHLLRESLISRFTKIKNWNSVYIFRAQTYIDCAWIPNWKKQFYHFSDFMTSPLVDLYVANGPEVEKELLTRSFLPKKKVINIINGTDKIGEPDELFKDSMIPLKIAMVSNLLEKKGHDVLIKSLNLLKDRGLVINARLIGGEISGGFKTKGPYFKEKLVQMAKDYNVIDQIEFFGYSNNVAEALKGIPIVVLPSDSEGVPNCILEAMSLRKLVVASNVGAVHNIINNGNNGFLHPPQNPEKLTEILFQLFSKQINELNLIRHEAYITWAKHFSLDRMILDFENQYNKF